MSRHIDTTPTFEFEDSTDEFPYQLGSASTNVTVRTTGWSPQSEMTSATTPSTRSPVRFMEYGPQLLPKVREQDQAMAAFNTASRHIGHIRTQSLPSTNGYPTQFGGHLPVSSLSAGPAPGFRGRSISPGVALDFNAPINTSGDIIPSTETTSMQRSSHIQNLTVPVSSVRSHSRHSSSGSIDAAVFTKYHFPTYRQSPGPQRVSDVPSSHAADAMSHLVPMAMPHGQIQQYPHRHRNPSPPTRPSRLSVEVDTAPMVASEEQTSLRNYLTTENPVTHTLQCEQVQLPPQTEHFWFDIRNVYEWSDFNVNKILSYEDLARLLVCPVDTVMLPEPPRKSITPVSRAHLAEICANYHLVKLNNALAMTQGPKHLSARALKAGPRSREQPEFVSNYSFDAEKTIDGDGRGRIVGIVRGFDEWNSGMRREDANKKIQYLRGLSALHKHMRDHRCRYGFIMNEIELVCVRAGGLAEVSDVPLFGFLELAAPVPVSRHFAAAADDTSIHMTVGVALWYLHMLARDTALPGQPDWQLQIGGPAAGTRQHHHKKDDWIPTPNTREKRRAKQARGWVFPDEPVSAKERGRAKRTRVETDPIGASNRPAMASAYMPVFVHGAVYANHMM